MHILQVFVSSGSRGWAWGLSFPIPHKIAKLAKLGYHLIERSKSLTIYYFLNEIIKEKLSNQRKGTP